MPVDAGFAAVVSVNEKVLTSVLRLIRSQKEQLFLNVGEFPIQPMSWKIYLDEQTIRCNAADGGTVRVALTAALPGSGSPAARGASIDSKDSGKRKDPKKR